MIYKSEIKNQKLSLYSMQFVSIRIKGDLAQMVERVLSMHEAQGSIPWFSTFLFSGFMAFKSFDLIILTTLQLIITYTSSQQS